MSRVASAKTTPTASLNQSRSKPGSKSISVKQSLQDLPVLPNSSMTQEELIEQRIQALPLPLDLLANGLSNLGPTPDSLQFAYLKLSIPVSRKFDSY